jgi:hypothetical protein
MANKSFPKSNLPIRKSAELLPVVFQTDANDKFLSGVLDPLIQPGVLEKTTGFVGRRYGKTFNGNDVYLDTDQTLRSRYQLEPGVIYKNHDKIENFYDYIDFKNQLKFFGNLDDRDDKITDQEHYTWNPPIDWDKFINYREYFWVPSGPPSISILGQSASITSTYKVVLSETNNSFIFTPDSYTNNPTITLYRGQTYKFRINAPGEGFSIRTNYDTGSLLFQTLTFYRAGSLVVYDDKLWRAKQDVMPSDGSSITLDSQDWEYVEPASSGDALEYKKGITNNGIENGVLTFVVPYDAPDILYYQGLITADAFGRFLIADIEENTFINVEKDILGKSTYTSSNGIELSNGMVLEFRGSVTPEKYSKDTWLVEGVGNAITLTKFSDLIVPVLTSDVPEVLFDNEGFDTLPFDDAASYPTYKDYITVSRDSIDRNPWSRYNRWFHRSVLEKSYSLRNEDFFATEDSRAKRPIIEFSANLQLFNFGTTAKETVDYVDDYTTDVFSRIEGSSGYNIDGEFLFEGARILVVADRDSLANNKIYTVTFITHNNNRQIHLVESSDSVSVLGDCVLVRRGNKNGGKMFHFNGTSWIVSQEKTKVNQPPLFDAFDSNGISFSDSESYPTSSFVGTKILSYKSGNGRIDKELGFALSYLNIDNVGDIQFNWDWDDEIINYTLNRLPKSVKISTGYFKINPNNTYSNGWLLMDNQFLQPIIDSQIIATNTNTVIFNSIDWTKLDSDPIINIYINDQKYLGSWQRDLNSFTFSTILKSNDVVTLKIICDIEPDQGYYEIPSGLEKNPFNDSLKSFTLGQAVDHITTALEFNNNIVGTIPGNSNLRDISDYQKYAKRFLKHSGLSPISVMLLCDKTHNIIKSLQYSKKSYTEFKNNFLAKAIEIAYNDNISDFVDDIINSLTKTKDFNSPFYDSDMIGAGAFTRIIYEVEDVGIKTFSLTEKFDLQTLSKKAVYVYLNNSQLLNTKDYEFNSTFGFVRLLIDLNEGDVIEIREYISTSTNHIPPTPTSLGLYKKYTPLKFLDDTYVEPREVIQGHDGSITAAFGDFRDDLLLELEYRIYNNIKKEYDEKLFDIDKIVGGYYGSGVYKKSQLDSIVNQEFLKWIQNTNINYTLNEYFDNQDSFTYTYSAMSDPTKTQTLPGYWRGVYKWFYDTDRPHRCPWEMLGFSEKPSWWNTVYGPAPYTKNNLILWEDLRDGVVKQGSRAGRHDRYKRPSLLDHIPVDDDGNLLSPLDSGLAQDFSLINNKGPFVLGDIGPVEYAWRSSSEWPFAVTLAMCLMKPFEFITDSYDRSITYLNNLEQTVNLNTKLFVTKDDISSKSLTEPSVGLIKYLVAYIKSRGISVDTILEKISNLDVALSHRMSGFVDQQQQKFLLDSKSPNSKTSSIYIPPENYDIIFNVSSPITSVSYSGVILEKTEGGWVATGYDDINPYFNYYQAMPSQKDPVISVGGVSETFVDWSENKNYNNGVLVRYASNFYRALKTHNSGSDFDIANWQKLGTIPKIGAVEALRRRSFNTLSIKKLSYGTKFTTIQQVVDFLLGYENYLKSVGFKFDRYDPENQTSQDWLSSCKEFMFWTKHNWEIGSLISLSPSAQKVDISIPVGVADNILDGFYDYQVLKGDGKPLQPRFINVNRSFQNVSIETVNTTDGIFYLKLYYVLKEHITIFDDRTVFNDIIYDKTTGYRQGRIKVQGFRTVDWDGDYTSPGFLFDNVNIAVWQPFTDYRLGDIVAYKSYNWVSLKNQLGTETFDDTFWSKLDTTPIKQLIPNFDYKINQFSDYFEVSSEGINQSQRDLARHTIGYQQRDYLQNLAEDPVSQFQLYQGFIREKGSANSISKIFGKLSRSGSDSIILNEEWAFLVGRMGGTDQQTEIEIQLEKNKFELNPQLFLVESNEELIDRDQNYRLTSRDFTIAPIPYVADIIPKTLEIQPTMTAGYVSSGQYQHVISSISDLSTLDINTVKENDHIWVTFYRDTWTVLRVNESLFLYVTNINRLDETTVEITFNRSHNFAVGDYIGFREIPNLIGFYEVVSISNSIINLRVDAEIDDPILDSSTGINPQVITNCRFDNYQSINEEQAALYNNGSRIFLDNNGESLWEVVEKNKQYSAKLISDYGTTTPLNTGEKVLYDNVNKHIITSIPGSAVVVVYVEGSSGLLLKEIISPPNGYYNSVIGSFGRKMAVTADGRFLIIGSPSASGVTSNFRGEWATDVAYQQDDIVLYGGRLWKAKNANTVIGDGSTDLAVNTDDWESATNIPAQTSGRDPGLYQQGMITIYEFANGRYTPTASFLSPRPSDNEQFGSEIVVSSSGSNYYLAVSAVGSYNSTGRVYLYKFDGQNWNHLENNRYKGIYNPVTTYYAGDIVWQAAQDPIVEGVKGNLWTSLDDSTSDGSTITLESMSWLKVSDISTNCSLPTNIAVEDDGSTLEFAYTGLISDMQMAEIIKQGDQFGFSMAMNNDGSLLVIGAPYSDGQYFANYRGVWRSDVEYVEGEVVRHLGSVGESYQYYRLGDAYLGPDSTYRSYNEDPSDSENWVQISDSTTQSSGKIFVYKRSAGDVYVLTQMINAGSISSFTDIDSGLIISTGDQFGFSMDLDSTGNVLVVSSPKADINFQDQGSVYVLGLDTATTEFRVKQRLESFEQYPNEFFGYGVSISPNGIKIAVGARNTSNNYPINFDLLSGTIFDSARTSFHVKQGYTGGVYIFDKKDEKFFLTEKLQEVFSPNESFGYSVDCVGSYVVVGSPFYRVPVLHADNTFAFEGPNIGNVRLFKKDDNVSSWNTLIAQQPVIDIRKIAAIELYDNIKNVKIQDIDYIDHAKFKILNVAEQEIKFKTPYDPAIYSVGNDEVVVDSAVAWYEKNVGRLWWNISTAKWFYAEQKDYSYRAGNWNQLVEGASIDVYEWVESVLLPSEWAALADTNEGIAEGISGQPLYPNDDVYSFKQFFNATTGAISETKYYYWVKSKTVVPTNMPGRTRASSEVASLISNPAGTGTAFIALIDSNKFLAYNFESILSSDTALINFRFKNDLKNSTPIHNEYQLLTEGVADSVPIEKLETKWIDSLIGIDSAGNRVPATNLPAKQKYGVNFRPRQTMFVDRLSALKLAITNINSVLEKEPFSTIIDFTNLNLIDDIPDQILNLYDAEVDTEIDLSTVGTVRTKRAVLQANIVNGELDTIDIIDPGFGYKVVPSLELEGDGTGAKASVTIDNQGRISTVTVTARGKKYSVLSATIRYFSVLVRSDSTINGFWSIYSWDDVRKVFFRSQSQAFDTTKYWSYIDWWKEGYDENTRVIIELDSIFDEPKFIILIGDLIRVKEYGAGGWAVFEKISDSGETFSDRFILVGRKDGTIQLSTSLYDTTIFGIGFDNTQTYDNTTYDIENAIELRNIFKAVKQDIFIGNYTVEWNKLFFSSIRYVLAEQQYVDWVFKTSFLNATHNIGSFEQKVNYKNDNLESYQDYIDEVKPFRTTVREYVSRYDNLEPYRSSVADFDLPPKFSKVDGKIVPITFERSELQQYPWKWWSDNNGYSVVAITVYDRGAQYTTPPKVLIEGDGTGAVAKAFISNGRVSGITMLDGGRGYTKAPTITLVGGNPSNSIQAKAAAVLGDTKVRTFDLSIKFDRTNKTGDYQNYTQSQSFIATGFTAVFELNYAPTRDKTKISILKNDQLVLNSDYSISLYYSSADSYSLLRGKLIFNQAPNAGDIIAVEYEKNIELLNAVNRIDRFYSPASGMIGKELNQLMTGVDFGGVLIQGTTFDVTGGWDALPWFTDNWDSVESSSDYYYVVNVEDLIDSSKIYSAGEIIDYKGKLYQALKQNVDGSGDIVLPTVNAGWENYWEILKVTLPFVPAIGQEITIYWKKLSQNYPRNIDTIGDPLVNPTVILNKEIDFLPQIRIDDPAFNDQVDSSTSINPEAQMPTFVGDGVTNRIEIGSYVSARTGDIIIFRPIESDGSVTITDENLVDTQISGGSLSAIDSIYVSATGTTAEEIVINGGKFVEPDHVPAPEENVPGQVLDSVSIKVYQSTVSGAAALQSKIIESDGLTLIYDIGQKVLENKSVIVYVNKIKKTFSVDYNLDLQNYKVEFNLAPSAGTLIEILSVGIGGLGILDYQEFVADGTTNLFLTNANYDNTATVFVTINGEYIDTGFRSSTDIVDAVGKTLIEFGFNPAEGDIVKIVCLEAASDVDSSGLAIIKVNTQTVYFEGSTRSFDLDNFVDLSRGSARNSMIVEVDGKILKGSDTTYAIYNGTNNVFTLGIDPLESAGSILPSNIRVFVNNLERTFITDYVFDGPTKVLTIYPSVLSIGDIIKIQNDLRAEYRIVGNNLVINNDVPMTSVDETDNVKIDITWFSEYPSFDVIADQKSGGKVQYQLSRPPISASYVWVYKNGNRLTQDQDYYVSIPRNVLYLNVPSTPADDIKTISFTADIFRLPSAYEIHKDMLNVFHYKRFAKGEVTLSSALNYYDTVINVSDSSSLTKPISNRNIPGIIWISGERIEYMTINGNTLGQLRRGTQGTSIGEVYPEGSAVVDIGYDETIPYNETQDRQDFVSDGSTLLVGPLDFVPLKSSRNSWIRNSIPAEYGPCDQVEIFAAGRRLRKDPIDIWIENNGSSSPQADETLEAEFSVNGTSTYIRLTDPLPAGTRITVIKRTGKIWYERGESTASNGRSLVDSDTPIAKFIAQKSTSLPE